MACDRKPDPPSPRLPPPTARGVRELSDRLEVEVVKDSQRRSLRALAEFLIDVALGRSESEDTEPSRHA